MTDRLPRLYSGPLPYAVAVCAVLGVTAGCLFSANVINFPYLVAFMAAVSVSALFGRGPGIVALILAILLSDFLFIPPAFQLDFDRTTWVAAAYYGLAAFLTLLVMRLPIRKRLDSKLKLFFFLLFENVLSARSAAGTSKPSLVGRLDGEIQGEIYGWALDSAQPSVAPKIEIYVENRPVAELNAVSYRPDVGSHGFWFDLTRCCPQAQGVHVDARFSNGRPVEHSPLIVDIPAVPAAQNSEALLFMHIAKTAGTAFRKAILENYKQSEIAYLYPNPPGFLYDDLRLLPLCQRANFRLIIGHFQYGIHLLLPQQSTYVTIVRDPVSRVISEFRYRLNKEDDSPRHLINLLEQQETVDLDNLMVRCFSGVSEQKFPPGHIDRHVYEVAVHNLKTAFSFVGHQENSETAYGILQQRFHWKPGSLALINRGPSASSGHYESVRRTIEHFNRWDCQLYSAIKQIFP
ncbi:MAG TPA: DUF4118 domain-containing protein [Bryobacteraceae bacterium]